MRCKMVSGMCMCFLKKAMYKIYLIRLEEKPNFPMILYITPFGLKAQKVPFMVLKSRQAFWFISTNEPNKKSIKIRSKHFWNSL